MSPSSQIVVAAHHAPFSEAVWRYTATVVADSSILHSWTSGFEHAKALFLDSPNIWFEGRGALERAKQLARLLAEEYRVDGYVLKEDVLFIKIREDLGYFGVLTSERI